MSLGIAVALLAVFAVAPDRLARIVEGRSRSPAVRDVVLTVWFIGWSGAVSWGLVRLQRRRII